MSTKITLNLLEKLTASFPTVKFDNISSGPRFIQYKPSFCNSSSLNDSSFLPVEMKPGNQLESQLCASRDSIVIPKLIHLEGMLTESSYRT